MHIRAFDATHISKHFVPTALLEHWLNSSQIQRYVGTLGTDMFLHERQTQLIIKFRRTGERQDK